MTPSKLVYPDADGKLIYATDDQGNPVIPDFSYAGYHASEKAIPDIQGPLFNVTDYGAVPDDGNDDQDAIQRAIDAAEAAGGGVVFFPPGVYRVNSDLHNRRPLRIGKGNVVLRGSGGWEGGTRIHIVQPTIPVKPVPKESLMGGWLQIGKLEGEGERLTALSGVSRRNACTIEVEDGSKLKPGMWISLRVKSREIVKDLISPYSEEDLSPLWIRIRDNGVTLVEHHSVTAVNGNRITLREPIKIEMNAQHGWYATTYEVLEEIGIEDICFQGDWLGKFYHHRSVLDDDGWNALKFNNTVHSWVRRCTFINLSGMVYAESSSYISILQLEMGGSMGHVSIGTPRRCTGILVGLCKETAMMQTGKHSNHSIGNAGSGVGHVFWRYTMHPDQSFDMHGMYPYATLFDAVIGGNLTTTGGPNPSFPNHLKDFVVWNFEHVKEPPYRNPDGYDFWTAERPKIGRPNIVKPVIVGMHGYPVRFVEETVGVLEGIGQKASPESLFEAELIDRLGKLPDWVEPAKREWERLQRRKLPSFPCGEDLTEEVAAKRADIFRFILETGNPNVWSPLKEGGDPIGELMKEWPSHNGLPWPPLLVAGEATDSGTVFVQLFAEKDTIIRFTLDGSDPTADSPVYAEPIPVSQGVTVKAAAWKKGLPPSFISSYGPSISLTPTDHGGEESSHGG